MSQFSFDFVDPTTAPSVLYIYDSPPTIAQVNNSGQGSLGVGNNQGAGVYSFNNLPLDANTKYYAVLPTSASIFDGSGNPYPGGVDMFPMPAGSPTTVSEGNGNFDAGFTATFQTVAASFNLFFLWFFFS